MIRKAKITDAREIVDIYSHYVNTTAITFAYFPPTIEEIEEKIRASEGRYIYLVIEVQGNIAGYAYSTVYRDREAYERTVEVSVYLHKDSTGKGYGKMLMNELLKELKDNGVITVIAVITSGNANSSKAFTSLGFTYSGHLPKVGYKCEKWYGIDKYYKIL